jgi:hypothetical protein
MPVGGVQNAGRDGVQAAVDLLLVGRWRVRTFAKT